MRLIITLFLIVCCLVQPVHAGNKKSVEKLNKEVEALRLLVADQSRRLAQAINSMKSMETEFQLMKGNLEEATHFKKLNNARVDQLETQLSSIEDQWGMLRMQIEEFKTAGLKPITATAKNKEFVAYERALSLINQQNYKQATRSLKAFIVKYPKSRWADNACFFVGESHFALGDLTKAVGEWQACINKYSRGDIRPRTLLKQAIAFEMMESYVESKAFLTKLIQSYPSSSEARQAKSRLARVKRMEQRAEDEAAAQQEFLEVETQPMF